MRLAGDSLPAHTLSCDVCEHLRIEGNHASLLLVCQVVPGKPVLGCCSLFWRVLDCPSGLSCDLVPRRSRICVRDCHRITALRMANGLWSCLRHLLSHRIGKLSARPPLFLALRQGAHKLVLTFCQIPGELRII